MSILKSKVFILSLIGFMLLFSPKIMAANFTDNSVVDSNKVWTIKFSNEVVLDDATQSGIVVTDSNGNNINVSKNLSQDKKSILVSAPQEGYKPGEKYVLTIDTNVHSTNNKKIKNKVLMNFSIKSNSVNYKIGDIIRLPYNNDNYKIIDLKQSDVDGDSNSEYVILGGVQDSDYYEKLCLIVVDPKTGYYKCSEKIDNYAMGYNTGIYLNDYDQDEIQDIRLNLEQGGNSAMEECLIFSDKSNQLQPLGSELFQNLSVGNYPFYYEIPGNHILKVTLNSDNSVYTIDLSKDSQWMDINANSEGNQPYVGQGPIYEDVKAADGSNLLNVTFDLSGACHGDDVGSLVTTYKYDKQQGEFTVVKQQVVSGYPCTKIQKNYLYNSDYLKKDGEIQVIVNNLYCDDYGRKYIEGVTYNSLNAEEAVDYERNTGNEVVSLHYENGVPELDDDIFDVATCDNSSLPIDENGEFYNIDFSSGSLLANKAVDFYQIKEGAPYKITLSNGKIVKMEQEYRP